MEDKTFEANTQSSVTGVTLAKRCDLIGKAHFNKLTNMLVPTPHVHEKEIPGGVRPAEPYEIPKRAAKWSEE
jgi:hypothetical protein